MAYSQPSRFKTELDLHIYIDMLRKRALRLPINYFLNAHLFDIVHGLDTHTELQKDDFDERPPNFESGHIYMPSWTNEIKRSFFILKNMGAFDKDYTFIDIGCGKGKVCLYWRLLNQKSWRRQERIVGIDYYRNFIETARKNSNIMFQDDGNFCNADVTEYDFEQYGSRLIIYLFNPFGRNILDQTLERLPKNDTFIVYNNPIYSDNLENHGFRLVHKRTGWHPCLDTDIFTNSSVKEIEKLR